MTQNNFKVKHGLEVPSIDSVYLSDTTTPALRPTLNLDFTKGFDPRITFTRASTATYYDGKTFSTGDENLLTYSNDFTQSVWDKTNTIITANSVIGPDGVTQNGSTLSEGTVNSTHKIVQSAGRTGMLTFSCYAKAATRNWLRLTVGDSNDSINAWFNLSTQTVYTTTNGTGVLTSATMVDAGNGWWRCVLIGNPSTSVLTVKEAIIGPADAAGTITYQGTDNYLYIYGSQLESRDVVTPYVETTSTPVSVSFMRLVTANNNIPRIDYNPVTHECKGLLIEEARTNIVTYSQKFDQWVLLSLTLKNNLQIAPDGTLTAAKIIETTGGGGKQIYQGTGFYSGVSGTTYTFSIYAKADTRRYLTINSNNALFGSQDYAIYDLVEGKITQVGSSGTSSIVNCGNGWYRCIRSVPCTSTGAFAVYFGMSLLPTAGRAPAYTGDGVSGLYIWGAQVETGEFATNYIPTNGSQGTRAEDSAIISGNDFSSWFSNTEGTICVDWYMERAISGNRGPFWFNDGNTFRGIGMYHYSDSTIGVQYRTATSAAATPVHGGISYPSLIRGILTYTPDLIARSINGGGVAEADATAVDTFIPNQVRLGYYYASGNNLGSLTGYIKKFQYYPKRLSNESIKSLSTR